MSTKPNIDDEAAHYEVVPLIEELGIEGAIVPNRRGELYRLAAAEIDRLSRELAEQKGALSDANAMRDHAQKAAIYAQQECLKAQDACIKAQEGERDALRYRWLRSEDTATNPLYYPFWQEFNAKLCREEDMDALIDSAMTSRMVAQK